MARFFRRGISKIYWLPAIASPSAGPSSGEFASGTNLSPFVQAINGFQLTNAAIDTPDLETTFDSQIDGVDTAADSGFDLYDDDVSATIRNLLAKGQTGFILLAPYGTGSGKRCEVWPVKSRGFNDDWTLDAKAAGAKVAFAITSKPSQAGAMP